MLIVTQNNPSTWIGIDERFSKGSSRDLNPGHLGQCFSFKMLCPRRNYWEVATIFTLPGNEMKFLLLWITLSAFDQPLNQTWMNVELINSTFKGYQMKLLTLNLIARQSVQSNIIDVIWYFRVKVTLSGKTIEIYRSIDRWHSGIRHYRVRGNVHDHIFSNAQCLLISIPKGSLDFKVGKC